MTEPRAWNAATGEPIQITLIRRAGRSNGEAVRSRATRKPGPRRQADMQTDGGAQRRGGTEFTVPAPLMLAKKLAPRSPKRQAAILAGCILADALLGVLRGR